MTHILISYLFLPVSHRVDVEGGQIAYTYKYSSSCVNSCAEMFSWLRDKSTTSYNHIQDSESPNRTTSVVSHQKQYANGRQEFYFVK
jgi:hypothetical protein